MTERFAPLADPRPNDPAWPTATWPPSSTQVLTGQWVELRRSEVDDAAELFAALDRDEVWQHVAGRPADVNGMKEIVLDKQQRLGWFPWTVRLLQPIGGYSKNAVVGTSSYLETSPADARTEIGSTLYAPAVWGTQVNPECKLLLLTHAFEVLQLGRVQLKTDVRNLRSQQAIARLGASFEGVLRRYQRRSDGSVRDTALFSITAEQWPGVRRGLEARLSAGANL